MSHPNRGRGRYKWHVGGGSDTFVWVSWPERRPAAFDLIDGGIRRLELKKLQAAHSRPNSRPNKRCCPGSQCDGGRCMVDSGAVRGMYTRKAVRVWVSALVLALVVAASPAIALICEMDCDHPSTGSEPCHAAHNAQPDAALHRPPHACNHDHTGGNPALLTSAKGRDSAAASVVLAAPPALQTLVHETRGSDDAAMHGPPGPIIRSTSSRLTVLRI
jgi:hypothetical protein